MKTARTTKILIIAMSVVAAASASIQIAQAAVGGPQSCVVNAGCTIGEYLFDDSYTPIADASCTLTARYPNGNIYINSEVLTPNSDGWYAYPFTAPATLGLYPAQICCTTADEEYLCIDKSFEIKSPVEGGGASTAEIAEAVWGYSGRTLPGLGNLAGDVWGYSGRSLSGFGNLVSDIWSSATRTLTGVNTNDGRIATQTDVASQSNSDLSKADLTGIEKTVKENRLLLEQLVNKPIIQNFLEEEEVDLGKKLSESKTIANQLYINHQYLTSKISSSISKWDSSSSAGLIDSMLEIKALLGEETDNQGQNSMFGQIVWLKNAWGWQETGEIFDQAKAIDRSLASVRNSLASSGKTNAALKELKSLNAYLTTQEKLIGDVSATSQKGTLFARITEVEALSSVLNNREAEADALIADLGKNQNSSLQTKLEELLRGVLAINRIPKAAQMLSVKTANIPAEKQLKNRLLGLKALIASNRLFLAKGAGVAFANTWLEEGSIVFKSLVTNPSNMISQKVPLKYYLPPEVKQEDILEVESGLSVNYDTEKGQFFVEGEFTLAPGETKTLSVRVDDIWMVTEHQIESLRTQAEELSKPLDKTSYFAQGVTLKSDIFVSLDKIVVLQAAAITPEQKIRAYREAQIELTAVNTKMDNLKDLVTQAGSTGTMFGFVGGAQALAVWGLIIIMAAGFVFLALYMKMISSSTTPASKVKTAEHKNSKESERKGKSGWRGLLRLALPMLVFGVISATVSGLVVKKIVLSSLEEKQESVAVKEIADAQTAVLATTDEVPATGGEEIVKILVEGVSINLRQDPDVNSAVVTKITSSTDAVKTDSFKNWIKVVLEDGSQGWVNDEFVQQLKEESGKTVEGNVIVGETPTGWLRVRQTPTGAEVARLNTGDKAVLVDEIDQWWQVQLEDGQLGWISKEYTSRE